MKMFARFNSTKLGLALALLPMIAFAQQPAGEQTVPATKTFTSAEETAALLAKAKSELKAGQPDLQEHALQLAPYTVNVEYRVSAGPPTVHEHEAEVFYVIDGAGVVVIGGKLLNEKRLNATNLTGTAIDGGASQKIAKGDMFFVPENTPHGFSSVDGSLQMMIMRVPRPVAAP